MSLKHNWTPLILIILLPLIGCGPDLPEEVGTAYQKLPDQLDYNFHIRPILSDRCFSCHGPDAEAREADLRLDVEEEAKARLASEVGYAIVSGKVGKSQVYHRIMTDDPEIAMPPPESNLFLTPEEKALLIKWIEQGAKYKPHWAFIPPQKPEVPKANIGRVANEIDHFILKKLEENELEQAPIADKERLLRRVSMDITGLPPTIEAMDAFLSDKSPSAYEKVVDHLLASDAFAERLTLEWLDLARYADSHGLHADGWRNAWPWRDWVINAFRSNMPYNEFITKQLAGDLLPNASKDDILATAFCRNHPMTAEGGAVDEEFRLEYVADRTNTTGTAFLGLTMECAKCHDHKYDPISQKDYYSLSAFFNNQKELGMTGDDGNYGPILMLSDEETDKKSAELSQKIQQLKAEAALSVKSLASKAAFIENLPAVNLTKDRAGYFPLERIGAPNNKGKKLIDGNPLCNTTGTQTVVEGVVGNAIQFDDGYDEINLEKIGQFEVDDAFSGALWINTENRNEKKTQTLMGNTGNKNNFWRGWECYLDQENRLALRLISILPHNYLHVVTKDSVVVGNWTHIAFSYDGSSRADGVQLFLDGKLADTDIQFDRLFKTMLPIKGPSLERDYRAIRVGKSGRAFTGENGIFKGKIDEIYVFNRALSAFEVATIAQKEEISKDQAIVAQHQAKQKGEYKEKQVLWKELVAEKIAMLDSISEVMVMEEMEKPRPTHVLNRGNYDQKKEEVSFATPANILAFPNDLPKNRLGLAKWLFLDDNPLTARVAVNRYWQMIFGKGLVKTPQDFGSQGALPTHPELLDWLAVSFREKGWDIRWLIKTMVLSETYQQSSKTDSDKYEKDPDNFLLARSPSYRYQGEIIRDHALAASGLLVQKVGGESVKPYQPDSLWIEKGTFSYKLLRYFPDKGDKLYRRSLYTFIKRTSPPPTMSIFDQPSRSTCVVKRETTNTPLQALVLLNDPQFVEAARVMAERIQLEAGEQLDAQIIMAFRLSTGRRPSPEEIDILKETYTEAKKGFEEDPKSAQELLSVGDYQHLDTLDKIETAALAMVASTIINHDEAYMKR